MNKLPIYFDYQSTTPVDKRVLEKMLPFFGEKYGNAHSLEHFYGWQAEAVIEKARTQVASLINACENEIIFTSGATESNNLAIKGTALSNSKRHIITIATEHKCVLESCKYLENNGYHITYLSVSKAGLIDLEELKKSITKNTFLISAMMVNNEIGVIQPIVEIGQICKEYGILFHSDAAQAFGKVHIDVDLMNIDLLSISGHKLYAPKGIGALYIRDKTKITPLFSGGNQEKGIRPGTLATPLIVALGAASAIAADEMEDEQKKYQQFFDLFTKDFHINGDIANRYPGNLNITIDGIDITKIKGIAISSSAACNSANASSSYVLKALGLSDKQIKHSFRIGFGRFTSMEEVQYLYQRLIMPNI